MEGDGFNMASQSKSFRSRFPNFLSNFSALGTGSLSLLIIQLISLPLFLTHLSTNQYAIWLTSFSVAQLALLLDFGSIASSQNLFSYLDSKGNRDEIDLVLKQTTNLLLVSNSIFLLVILALDQLAIGSINVLLIAIFVLSNLMQSFFGLLEGMMRIDSKVAISLHFSNGLRGAEFIGTVLAVINFSESLSVIAMFSFLFKFLFFTGVVFFVPRRFRFIKFGPFKSSQIVKIIHQGFPFFLVKISDMININGVVIILSGILTASNLVIFTTTRTFFRFGLQLTGLVSNSFAYEMSSSWVESNLIKMQTLIRESLKSVLWLSLLIALIYQFAGEKLIAIWTHDKVQPASLIFTLGALYSIILSINQNQKSRFNAVNHNFQISLISFVASIILVLFLLKSGIEFTLARLLVILSATELISTLIIALVAHKLIYNYFQLGGTR